MRDRLLISLKIGIIILASCVSSCRNESLDEKLSVAIKSSDNILQLSNHVSSYELIPLETNEDCLIGTIDNFMVFGDYFIIADKNIAKKILIFSTDGSFIGVAGQIGNGPFEYNSIRDVTIDPSNNAILMYDISLGKLIWFSMTGEPLLEKKIRLIVDEISCTDQGIIICYSPNSENFINDSLTLEPGIFSYDPKNNTFDQLYEIDRSLSEIPFSPGLSGFGNNINVCMQISDTIYSVSEDSMVPLSVLDFGKYKTPNFSSLAKYQAKELNSKMFVTGKHLFRASKECLFFAHTIGSIIHFNLFTDNLKNYSHGTKLENDVFGMRVTAPIFLDEKYLYCYTKPLIESEFDDKSDYGISQKEKIFNLNESANPILVKFLISK